MPSTRVFETQLLLRFSARLNGPASALEFGFAGGTIEEEEDEDEDDDGANVVGIKNCAASTRAYRGTGFLFERMFRLDGGFPFPFPASTCLFASTSLLPRSEE